MVDYAAMQADPSALERYVDVVTGVTREQLETWTEPQRLAFLINAYNALTVALIVENYPVISIKDLGGGGLVTLEEAFLYRAGEGATPR